MKIDGLAASATPSTYAAAINNRLSVPSYIDIEVNCVGNASGGTAYISVTAEQEPPAGTIKVWSNILEDHEIATGAWGGYNGQEMMWIPVAWPLTTNGSVLNFTGPYPQTIEVEGNYTLNPVSDIFDNLNVSAWVQLTTGNKEVLNASSRTFPILEPAFMAMGPLPLKMPPFLAPGQTPPTATSPWPPSSRLESAERWRSLT